MILDPLVVCGPSGVGKGTIIHKFQQDYPDLARHFGFTVSHTTRAPRAGEVDGVHYHFVSHKDMAELRAADAFLESAEVHGNVYGTSWQALRDVQQNAGQRCLLDIDVQGVQRLKVLEASMATNPQADFGLRPNYVFIAPPTLEALQDRLHGRQSETAESLQRRFANAAAEVAYGQVEGHFNAVVVNADLDQAVADFVKAVQGFYQL
jgi:guanylate kinase